MNKHFIELSAALQPLYGAGEARAIAFVVFEDGFGVSRTDLYADKVRQFSEEDTQTLRNMCRRLLQGEPVQQVVGSALFMGHRFSVTPQVLIPRPETEELVQWAIDVLRNRLEASPTATLSVLDAGTGSGCIAISIKKALPQVRVVACDLSPQALEVARGNALRLGADVHFLEADLLHPSTLIKQCSEDFDLIVSNPPYILEREAAQMERHVLEHEPHTALFVPNAEPLLFYKALCCLCAESLHPGGTLLVEINSAYGHETADLFRQSGFHHVELRTDAYGLHRMVAGCRSNRSECI